MESGTPEHTRAGMRTRPGEFVAASDPQRIGRFLLLRGMGLVYFVAFAAFWRQGPFLFDSNGLTPISLYLRRASNALGPEALSRLPSLFWLDESDGAVAAIGIAGVALSFAVLLGLENAAVMAVLWVFHVSVVNAGQDWYGYGWETLLAEAGFLSIFLCSPWGVGPRGARRSAAVQIWLFRWLIFRILLGAGLIKLRGDPCWRELTCLIWHYETQPNPHPLSILFHWMPPWFHAGGVLFNHFVELICPFFLLGPPRLRWAGGLAMALFQGMLILSGNLAFLNWLTLFIGISAFDDAFWRRVFPDLEGWLSGARATTPMSRFHRGILAVLVAFVTWRSVPVVDNLFFAERQAMNRSYDPLHLVNTYGAFGSVGDQRFEAVVQGTNADPADPATRWLDYEFVCKPGDISRPPCLITPYHLHLDWQMWFIPLQGVENHRWVVNLLAKILAGDPRTLGQFAVDPFGGVAPGAVRLAKFQYHFVEPGERNWWSREARGNYIRPLTRDDPALAKILAEEGWD